MPARKAKQLEVITPDEVGTMACLFGCIADAKVNIRAYCAWTMEGKGHFLLVTESQAKAERIAREHGYEVRASDVVVVETADKVGAGAALARRLADAGINIDLSYASSVGKGRYLSVLRTSDNAKAARVLK